jgi:tRNA(fMet)-specific endonuclease VapC
MRYLLDTCVISDFIKGEVGTQGRLKQTPPNQVTVSVITVIYGITLWLVNQSSRRSED